MRITMLISIGLVLTTVGVLLAAAPPQTEKENIARLIKQLGAEEYAIRQAASKKLKDIGEPARDALEAGLKADDLEIRRRARQLLFALPPKYFLRTIATDLSIHCVAVSPDDKLIAMGGGLERSGNGFSEGKDYDVRIFDHETGKEVRRLAVVDRHVGCLSFSPDGKFLAAVAVQIYEVAERSKVIVWDVATGKVVHTLTGHSYVICSVTFSPDGKQILTCGWDRTIRLWDAKTGAEIRKLGHGRTDWQAVAFLPDGKQAIACGLTQGGSPLVLLDVETGKVVRSFPWGRGRLASLSMSPDGKRLLTTGADDTDGRVRLWDVEEGKLVRTFDIPKEEVVAVPRRPQGSAMHASFLPDRQRFVMACNASMHLCDANTGKILHTYAKHTDAATTCAASTKGTFAVSGSFDKTVNVWRLPEDATKQKGKR